MESFQVPSMTELDPQPVVHLKGFARRHVPHRITRVAFTFIGRQTGQEWGDFRELLLNCRRSLHIRDLFEKESLGEPDLRGQCRGVAARFQLGEVPANSFRSLAIAIATSFDQIFAIGIK